MNVLMAINHEGLVNYISKLEAIKVSKILISRKNILSESESINPDIVIISHTLPGDEDISDILNRLSTSRLFSGRIIYLYGDDDTQRKIFINELILRGIYDYHVGELDTNIVKNLLFKPKSRNDVKDDILDISTGITSKSIIDEQTQKPEVKFVDRIIEVPYEVKVPQYIKVETTNTIKQQVLAFYTTDNSLDKDDVLTQISTLIAKKCEEKILVIDMNPVTATLDHFFGIEKFTPITDIYNSQYNTGLKMIYSAIEKKIFAAELLEEVVIKHSKYKNLHILTGLYDMNLFNSLEESHYEKLIDEALVSYSTIIINTNPSIFVSATYVALKRATSIITICNANYTYARNTNFIFKYLNSNLKIPKSKLKLIINNTSQHSLDNETMKKIFSEHEIIGSIPFNKAREECLNERKIFITSVAAKNDIPRYLSIVEKLGYIPKQSFINKLFKRKDYIKEITEVESR